MIQITYNEVGEGMILRAEGHAGYAEKGKDIVCAAVSALLQALAYSVGNGVIDGGNTLTVQAVQSCDNMAKFELVLDGLQLLAEQYPENVRYTNLHAERTDAMDLQLFAEGGGDGGGTAGDGAAAADAGEGEAASSIELPKLRPAEERLARRSGMLKPSKAGLPSQSPAATALPKGEPRLATHSGRGGIEQSEMTERATPADEDSGKGAENQGSSTEENAGKQMTPEEHRKAFGALMQGEYKAEFEQMMQRAIEVASKNITADPKMVNLMGALAEAYGIEGGDLDELTEAVKNGRVKDEAYFEKIAMEKGISVKTARELDKLETENRRMTAAQAAAEQQRKAAQRQAEIAQLHEAWNREAEQLKAEYPDFDLQEMLANEQVKDLMRKGVSMGNAYRAIFFDKIMAQNTARTAQQVERGVEARIQQRNNRPGENGTRPGGAIQMKLDVESMTRKEREKLERDVMRGKKITF